MIGTRRTLLKDTAFAAAASMLPLDLLAQDIPFLDVACAGSVRPMLEGPMRAAVAASSKLNLRVHAQGADAVAKSIIDGSLPADVFIPITAGPMLTVMSAGKTQVAKPFARTELVAFRPYRVGDCLQPEEPVHRAV
ncbi:substrate-binding domain-containing protein [Granulicella tundricola]|uniref:substrate-binding domain-containing protein n=1 Tax=Granulicella tundricola TaxID=940615 RepID=UPI0001DB7C62|nr:substrate-binding domain-containing protein [Granulicella tundricola]